MPVDGARTSALHSSKRKMSSSSSTPAQSRTYAFPPSSNSYWSFAKKRLERLQKYSRDEIEDIVKQGHELQSQDSKQDGILTESYVSIFGFAPQVMRNLLLRSLRVVVAPRILHASYIDKSDKESQRFEAVLTVNLPPDGFEKLEKYIELWRVSGGLIDLDTNMSRPMVTAINRICNGRGHYGNWNSMRAQGARTLWYHNFRMIAENEARQRVQEETGRAFTTGNMLSLHYDMQNQDLMRRNALAVLEVLYTDVQVLRNTIGDLSNAAAQLRSAQEEDGAMASNAARTHLIAVNELANFAQNVVATASTRHFLVDTVHDILAMDLQDRIANLQSALSQRVRQAPIVPSQRAASSPTPLFTPPNVVLGVGVPPPPSRDNETEAPTPQPAGPEPTQETPPWRVVPLPMNWAPGRNGSIGSVRVNSTRANVPTLMLSYADAAVNLSQIGQNSENQGGAATQPIQVD